MEKKDIEFTLEDYADMYEALQIACNFELLAADVFRQHEKDGDIANKYQRLRIKVSCNIALLKNKVSDNEGTTKF